MGEFWDVFQQCDTLDLFNASIDNYQAKGNVAFNSGSCQHTTLYSCTMLENCSPVIYQRVFHVMVACGTSLGGRTTLGWGGGCSVNETIQKKVLPNFLRKKCGILKSSDPAFFCDFCGHQRFLRSICALFKILRTPADSAPFP